MKALLLTLIVSLSVAIPSAANQSSQAKEERLRSGTNKIRIGAILMGAGVVLMIASPQRDPGPLGTPAMAGGMGLVLWGTKQRSDALRPQLTFGAAFGRSKGVWVSRLW
jgi:hypothetical protein